MGNLPCCGANEQSKPKSLSAPSHFSSNNNNSNDIYPSTLDAPGITGTHASLSNHNNNLSSNHNSNHNQHHLNPNNVTSESDKFQLEEQQRALHQEQERLARIVNDANQNMVPLTGSSSTGMHGGRTDHTKMRMGVGYYDANYAAEVWQDLIPGRNNVNGGGLIHRCQAFMKDPNSNVNGANGNNNMDAGDAESHLEFPKVKGGMSNEHMVDALAFMPQTQQDNGHGHEYALDWNEDAVKMLNELIYAGSNSNTASSSGTGAVTVALRANEGMEMLVDDLAERFLATVFQEQRGFLQGLPIVENVL